MQISTAVPPARPADSATVAGQPALCVSLHDVAPATWGLCLRLIEAVEAVAPIPLTLLVVPNYHYLPVMDANRYRAFLEAQLARGNELALHGYTHLDEGPPATGLGEHLRRRVYTQNEGEFAALCLDQAQERLEQGLLWFAARGWPLKGFVAPAWLLSQGSWDALRRLPFKYTTTLRNFYLLPQLQALLSPSLVYSARNPPGRWLSRRWNDVLAKRLDHLPLVRLGLHPNDARHPAQLAHMQTLLEGLLVSRQPLTKAGFADRW